MATVADVLEAMNNRMSAIETRLDTTQEMQNTIAEIVLQMLGDKVPEELRAKFLHSMQLTRQSIAVGKKVRDGG